MSEESGTFIQGSLTMNLAASDRGPSACVKSVVLHGESVQHRRENKQAKFGRLPRQQGHLLPPGRTVVQ